MAIAAFVGLATVGGGCARYTITRYDELMESHISNRDRIGELERVQARLEHRIERLEGWHRTSAP